MTFRKLAVAIVCLLAVGSAAQAQQVCSPYMAAGTYLMNLSGWATVAVTPIPIFGPTTSVIGGTANALTMTASKVTVAGDCMLTFKATCAQGCQWEGQGYFNKTSKEMSIIFTKAVGDTPLTVTGTLKQISN